MTVEDWKPSAAAVEDGLLPFQRQFVAAVCRTESPPEVAATVRPTGATAKVVVMRRAGSAVADAG